MSKYTTIATDTTFDRIIKQSKAPVLVDFWAAWCGPCRSLTPTLEELAKEFGDRVKVVKLNVDEQKRIAKKMGIRSIPTVVIFNNGEAKETIIGLHNKEYYKNIIIKVTK